jgi:hypothetical protein
MKCLCLFVLFSFACLLSLAQPLIHAHNDYQKQEPLINALRNKVFSIEADVFLSGNRLLVAHNKNELTTAPTLDSLYLQPIIELFRKHKGTISEDTAYAPVLMIDIKENGEPVLAELIKLLSAHLSVFDRSINAKAVQIVISGDRGPSFKWITYPSFILFDGRPSESYDNAKLQRIAFISDSWVPYNLPPVDDYERLKQVIDKVHGLGKPIRLWASPDNPDSWQLQKELGIDIINTDKAGECREYFIKTR